VLKASTQVQNFGKSAQQRVSQFVYWLVFYHIRQVAANVAKLVLGCAFGTTFWGKERSYGVSNDNIRNSDGGIL